MKKTNAFIHGLCSALVLAVLFGCATAKVAVNDDGSKMLYSKSRITEWDFMRNLKGFFTVNTVEPAFSGFDLEILMMMKSAISGGTAKGEPVDAEMSKSGQAIAGEGEIIDYIPLSRNEIMILDSIYDKETGVFVSYGFVLTVLEDEHKEYRQLKELQSEIGSYISKCRRNIDACNDVIERANMADSFNNRLWYTQGTVSGGKDNVQIAPAGNPYAKREPVEINMEEVARAEKNLQYWTKEENAASRDYDKVSGLLAQYSQPFLLKAL